VSGVRNSWDASAVKRRSVWNARSRRSSASLTTPEVLGRDPTRPRRHRRDGRERAAGQQVAGGHRHGKRKRQAEAQDGGELAEFLACEALAAADPYIDGLPP
jgi:hypothetical protein